MTREERTKLIKHLKYARSIGADYLITDKDVDEIIKALEQEPKTGHWYKSDGIEPIGWYCSECGLFSSTYNKPNYKFCPNCGARMIDQNESEETE